MQCDFSYEGGWLQTVSMHHVKLGCSPLYTVSSAVVCWLSDEHIDRDPTSIYLHKNLMQLKRLVACLLGLLPCTKVVMEAAALTAFPGAVGR
jgi:hypothetical protein